MWSLSALVFTAICAVSLQTGVVSTSGRKKRSPQYFAPGVAPGYGAGLAPPGYGAGLAHLPPGYGAGAAHLAPGYGAGVSHLAPGYGPGYFPVGAGFLPGYGVPGHAVLPKQVCKNLNEIRARSGFECTCLEYLTVGCPRREFAYPRCTCPEGFVRNHQHHCIPLGSCIQCSPNENLAKCGAVCNCRDFLAAGVCVHSCAVGEKMCFCREGFVRDNVRGVCIPEATCQ